MKNNKQPLTAQVLIASGLLLVTLPTVVKEYVPIPDFFRGFFAGLGLMLEISGLIVMRMKSETWCRYFSKPETRQQD